MAYFSEGEEYAEVTRPDFVTGLKHANMVTRRSLSLSRIQLKDWLPTSVAESNDSSTVGVKAVDDYTVEYTLNKPENFWNSKVTNSNHKLPVNEEFWNLKEKDYGTPTPSSILFIMGLIFKIIDAKRHRIWKNPNYWGQG